MNATAPAGAGPPQNVAPADLWTKLTMMPRPHTEVAFPRKDHKTGEPMTDKVAIWVLTEAELMAARAAADLYAKEMLKDAAKNGESLGYQELYLNAKIVELVYRCCRSTLNVQVQAFPSTQMIRKFFTSDEIAVLFRAYCAFQAESGPLVSAMTPEEMDAWIDSLIEAGSAVPLAAQPSDNVTALLMHSVSLLRKYRQANGSAGSPPDGSSPNTDPQSSPHGSPSSRLESSSLVDESERPGKPEADDLQ